MEVIQKYISLFLIHFIVPCCCLFLYVISSHSTESPSVQAVLTTSEIEFLLNHHTIKVQVAREWSPYNFAEDGQAKGYVNDYLRMVAEKLGIELEFIHGHSWNEYMQMLLAGEIDLISNMTITPERSKRFLFSENAVFNVLNGLLTTRENSRLADLETLQGRKLAVVKGYAQEELLRHYYPDISLIVTDSLLDSIRQVIVGKADAAIGAHGVFSYLAAKHLIFEVESAPIRGNEIFPTAPHHLAVNRESAQLLSLFEKAMALVTDNELNVLHNKWLNFTSVSKKHISFSKEEQAYLGQKKQITMCVDPDWMPLEKIEQGKHVGMVADYIQLLEENINIPIVLVPTENWPESIEYAKARECDIFSLAMSTPNRRAYMYFSKPYLDLPLVVVSKADSPFIADISALRDEKLGVVKGYAFGELLRNKYPELNIVDVSSHDQGLHMVAQDELYGFIGTLITVGYSIQNKYVGELKVAGKFDEQWELGIATRNDEPMLLSIFDKAIIAIDEGARQEILNRWVSVTFDEKVDYKLLWRILFFVFLGALLLFYRSYALSKYNRQLKIQNSEISRQAELLRKTQTELLFTQQAVDSCAFPICWLSLSEHADTKLIHVNQAAAELLGYSRDEMFELSINDFDKGLTAETWERLLHILKEENSLSRNRLFTCKDGSTFPAELFVSSFESGGEAFLFIFFTDVSREKEMEKKLHRSLKMEAIGTMAGGVAHDLNNILSGVVSYPEILLLTLEQDSKLRKPLETIMQAGKRAADVVADMLTVARGITAIKEPANINTIIKEYNESPEFQELMAGYPEIKYRKNLNDDLLNISCSQLHIRKCLMNLITNAVEAIKGQGEITIATTNLYIDKPAARSQHIASGEYVVLTISDTGPGIAKEFISHIFEPFYSKKVMGKSGTGLGLAVVWNTVQDHGGSINVESNKQGSTFTINLPATRDQLFPDLEDGIAADIKGDGQHILVIDDEFQQRDICQQMLMALCYKVDCVASGEDALEFLYEQEVELVVLDMIMEPGLSGRETYEKITEFRPEQKAIIVSGFSKSDDVLKTQKMGAKKFIRKPYSLQQIGRAVKETLYQRG